MTIKRPMSDIELMMRDGVDPRFKRKPDVELELEQESRKEQKHGKVKRH